MYVYLWRYVVRHGSERAFEVAYGPDGEWVRLFRIGDGHLGTIFLRDLDRPRSYLTMDRWSSRSAFDTFRAAHGAEWEAIDARCATLTESEEELGQFEGLDR